MPNAKISALTSATTPLAGTETLPIVQSSTTKQVSVANLTAGRNVSMSGGTVTSGGATRSYRPDNAIYTDQYMAAGASGGYIFNNANGDGFKWQFGGVDQFLIDTSGNAKVSTGNLSFGTAGKQILGSSGRPALNQTGGILQVVSAIYNTQVSSSPSAGSYVDTGLTASITPSTTSSKILVIATMGGMVSSGAYSAMNVAIIRGATFLIENKSNQQNGLIFTDAISYLDSPATTSSTTYKIQMGQQSGGAGTLYAQIYSSYSTITLLEVAA